MIVIDNFTSLHILFTIIKYVRSRNELYIDGKNEIVLFIFRELVPSNGVYHFIQIVWYIGKGSFFFNLMYVENYTHKKFEIR